MCHFLSVHTALSSSHRVKRRRLSTMKCRMCEFSGQLAVPVHAGGRRRALLRQRPPIDTDTMEQAHSSLLTEEINDTIALFLLPLEGRAVVLLRHHVTFLLTYYTSGLSSCWLLIYTEHIFNLYSSPSSAASVLIDLWILV